ncbi:plasmid pRiA4b ORF-3 family protein [Luteibaculum oceani]|uniref:Plasmid pRiA4b ORF-3 family protein n=1 Tax=Luteibaculum oceani TaxID=1294296 RepID=A0A5C6V961_9FLAO|nr:plasmid pRiA4b ORF-3 family protein [Luteibaculum oceani]TXC81657.1 plasmid pRiA4b ORF-3 family protein [Luteibaculum oceani]
MKSFTLHVLVDTKEKTDVFRDIKISADAKLETLHKAILKAFDFKGQEMAAFYSCDKDWERLQEFPQMAMDKGQEKYEMGTATIADLVKKKGSKALYVYDFLKMWCFLIEVINVSEEATKTPKVLLTVGKAPKESEKKVSEEPSFEGEGGIEDFNDNWDDDDEYDDDSYQSYDEDYNY